MRYTSPSIPQSPQHPHMHPHNHIYTISQPLSKVALDEAPAYHTCTQSQWTVGVGVGGGCRVRALVPEHQVKHDWTLSPTWMGLHYRLGFASTVRFLWSQILCLKVCFKKKSAHILRKAFGWGYKPAPLGHVYTYHKKITYDDMHVKRSCSPCYSLVDYGNTKISQHTLNVCLQTVEVGHSLWKKKQNLPSSLWVLCGMSDLSPWFYLLTDARTLKTI